MLSAALGLLFLLLFSELAAANFKRLSPVLEAWDGSKTPHLLHGGWQKLAVFFWALGTSIPLLAFTLACHLFVNNPQTTSDLTLGATIGSNIIGLSLAFGLILLKGPIHFFRLRTITSPVFLLLATVAFTYVCLNNEITRAEGGLLLLLAIAYSFYFRRFSSEWTYYERQQVNHSLTESTDGLLPIIAVFCMGIGFFVLAVMVSYPFVTWIDGYLLSSSTSLTYSKLATHVVAFFLALPWLFRSILSMKENDTGKALTLTSISHACLLNVLFLPGIVGLVEPLSFSMRIISVDLPVLLCLTGVFVCSLLVEKEKGGLLTILLIVSYLFYTGLGLLL